MPLTVDSAIYQMTIQCDGKKTAMGCMIADYLTRPTREECNMEIYRRGWRISGERTLCRLCVKREFPKLEQQKYKTIAY